MSEREKNVDNLTEHRQRKDYELDFGKFGNVSVRFDVSINNFCEGDTREVIKRFAECSQDFYLELGDALYKKR